MTDVEKIHPGLPNYEERMKELTKGLDMDEARKSVEWMGQYIAGSIVLEFKTMSLPGKHPECSVSHAIDRSNKNAPKLIFQFQHVSREEMGELGYAIYHKVVLPLLIAMPGDIHVYAEESPIYRSRWDFVAFGIPSIRTQEVYRLILQTAQNALLGRN